MPVPDDGVLVTDTSADSAITGTWAWGNSVDPAVDERGRGQADLAPAAIAAFARQRRLGRVFCNAPWAANTPAMSGWLAATVDGLTGLGVRVAALGGDRGWFDEPALAARWLTDARSAAGFTGVQLDVEPWAGETEPIDPGRLADGYLRLIDAVRAVAGPLLVGADLPWWLARMPLADGTVFDPLVAELDSVAIVAFSDHADGEGGIVDLATPAVRAAEASRTAFSIGVETDRPDVAGGAQYTFFDEGQRVLESEAAKVRRAFSAVVGYEGVTVEHLLAWKNLRP